VPASYVASVIDWCAFDEGGRVHGMAPVSGLHFRSEYLTDYPFLLHFIKLKDINTLSIRVTYSFHYVSLGISPSSLNVVA
jgi:hypothetical protein